MVRCSRRCASTSRFCALSSVRRSCNSVRMFARALVAPTTDAKRLPLVLDGSSGFVYYVSITGVTGTRTASADELAAAIPLVRQATDLPVAIGFGVRSPAQAAAAVRAADAAVVASALLDTLAGSLDEFGRAGPDTVRLVLDQVRALADAVRSARATA